MKTDRYKGMKRVGGLHPVSLEQKAAMPQPTIEQVRQYLRTHGGKEKGGA